MPSQVLAGYLIVLLLSDQAGFSEDVRTFSSMDELYKYCLTLSSSEIVDRIAIWGKDENGQLGELTFVFQSTSVALGRKP